MNRVFCKICRTSMTKRLTTSLLTLLSFVAVFAQNGKITGTIYDAETKEPIPFAAVRVIQGGIQKAGVAADIDGRYSAFPLTPGAYDIEVSALGYQKIIVTGINVFTETTVKRDFNLKVESKTLQEVEIIADAVPLIDFDNTSTGAKLTAKDIEKLPTRSINSVLTTQAGVFSRDDGAGINIRGARESDNAVFVNGVRLFSGSRPPVEAVQELSVITGGVPAQYGDLIGGVVNITTKGPAAKTTGNVQFETSRLFDKWQQDLLSVGVSGPIWKKKEYDENGNVKSSKSMIGYFTTFQYSGQREPRPAIGGYWQIKDETLERMKREPLTRTPTVDGRQLSLDAYRSVADYFTKDDFVNMPYRRNNTRRGLQGNATVDFQPLDNVTISLGGNFSYGRAELGSTYNLFNYENNGLRYSYDWNAFVRFRQNFYNFSDSSSIIKNIFYQVQLDYSQAAARVEDRRHRDKIFRYNHVGFYEQQPGRYVVPKNDADLRTFIVRDPFTGTPQDTVDFGTINTERHVFLNYPEFGKLFYQPGPHQRDLSLYNEFILARENPQTINQLFNGFGGVGSRNWSDFTPTAGYFFGNYGGVNSGYSRINRDQFRLSAQTGAEIGRHTIRVGFEYEQRVTSSYAIGSPNQLRRLVNNHIFTDFNQGVSFAKIDTIVDSLGVTNYNITADFAVNPDIPQTNFDRNLRNKLGYAINRPINLDMIDPDLLSIDMLSPQEIFGNGINQFAFWQGYDAYGNRQRTRSSFNDFFTDTINRPVDGFRPTYIAGYIEDKFEIKDFILRVGLRVDRYDLNQPVLIDPYSLTKLQTAGEANLSEFNSGRFVRPATIGDDFAVYVNKPVGTTDNQRDYNVVGFRNGNQWYDANGAEISGPEQLRQAAENGLINPWFRQPTNPFERRLQEQTGITLDAFRDYEPQINVLPRVSLSFPISEDAGFFAHYDILTRRPLTLGPDPLTGAGDADGEPFASPVQYYNFRRNNGTFLANPNLRPQQTIDYELGFRQRISQRSAITLSAFYREIRNLVTTIQIVEAYPRTYNTLGNQDFGTVKGFTFGYDLRRSSNARIMANYTLQFAEGTASNFADALRRANQPNLRIPVPLGYDQRHALKLTFDYRLNKNEGPVLFGKKIFENAGFNTTFYAGSGTPYTRVQGTIPGEAGGFAATQISGGINGSRLPWQNRTSLRIDKTFDFGKTTSGKNGRYSVNVYFYVQNLFNARNILGVYAFTGSPVEDGYLTSDQGLRDIRLVRDNGQSAAAYMMYYRLLMENPGNFALPRRMRIGAFFRF